ncbi:MAG: hypothetical protein Q7U60_06250, partial [Candidatus Methanoperedens sp.]|nr:hypothetical protein [Candidatus Methanoperedens sp.]
MMKNKTIVLFTVLLLVITAGCLGEQSQKDTAIQGRYEAPLKSEMSRQEKEKVASTDLADTLDRTIISTASLTIEEKSV